MGKILLLDDNTEHAEQIAEVLHNIACQTTTCPDVENAVSLLQRRSFDAVVVVSVPGLNWDIGVQVIRRAAFQIPEPLPVVCLLRSPYCGPSERIYAARHGFKVVYEH